MKDKTHNEKIKTCPQVGKKQKEQKQSSSVQVPRAGLCAENGRRVTGGPGAGHRAPALSWPTVATLSKAVLEASNSNVYFLIKCESQSIRQINDSI